jgi:excisionase family DNA binding protein
MSEAILSISEAAKLLDVCENTLRDWDIEEKFIAQRTAGGHRRYSLDQIREYLEKNPKEPETNKIFGGKLPDVKNLKNKWEKRGYLKDCFSDKDADNLAIILENTEEYNKIDSDAIFSTNQILELTKETWIQTTCRKIISIQPFRGPVGLAFYIVPCEGGRKIESEAIAVKTQKYNLSIFGEAKFEDVKHLYAKAMAAELNHIIVNHLPYTGNYADNLVDASAALQEKIDYDFFVGPQAHCDILKTRDTAKHMDFYPITILNENTFSPISYAGKYHSSSCISPIFVPYILIYTTPILGNGTSSMFLRIGWKD